MREILEAVAVFLLGLALSWYGGVDFTERGFPAAAALGVSAYAAFTAWFILGSLRALK